MAKKPRIDVILTPAAREALADEAVRLALKNGRHFNCEKVQQNGYFMDLTIRLKNGDKTHVFDLSIPCNYVLYMISSSAREISGFLSAESQVGTKSDADS